MRRPSLWLTAGLAALLGGCVGPFGGDRIGGAAAAYRAGEPAFELDALATVEDGETGIDVYLSLPPQSLIYRQTSGAYEAAVRWAVAVEGGDGADVTLDPVDTVRVATAEAAREADPVTRVLRVDVPPGRYVIEAVAEDAGSGRTARRRERVEVVAPAEAPALSGLRLEGRLPSGRVGPLVARALPARVDSLTAVAQATAAPDGAVAALTVLRYRADTTAAALPSAYTPRRTALVARGVDAVPRDTVQAVRQPLGAPGPAVRIEAPVPPLAPGLYRVTLDLLDPDSGERLARAARVVAVRRRDYPRLTRLGDLVEPLVYIADPGELRRLRRAVAGPGGRRAFDRFWGEEIDDRRVAAATLRAYYDRVEEANRLFGNHKDGWKTDPGMAYILFGPPAYVDQTPSGETWTYGSRGAAPPVLVFEQTAGQYGDASPTSVLTLVRDRQYHEAWLQARRDWRTGRTQ